jgi:hypothetical protein
VEKWVLGSQTPQIRMEELPKHVTQEVSRVIVVSSNTELHAAMPPGRVPMKSLNLSIHLDLPAVVWPKG